MPGVFRGRLKVPPWGVESNPYFSCISPGKVDNRSRNPLAGKIVCFAGVVCDHLRTLVFGVRIRYRQNHRRHFPIFMALTLTRALTAAGTYSYEPAIFHRLLRAFFQERESFQDVRKPPLDFRVRCRFPTVGAKRRAPQD